MPGEYDEKFEQLTGLVEGLAKKVDRSAGGVDEMRLEMRDMRTELSDNTRRLGAVENRLGTVESKVDLLSAQFKDVAGMAIKDHGRIDDLGGRVDVLEAEAH